MTTSGRQVNEEKPAKKAQKERSEEKMRSGWRSGCPVKEEHSFVLEIAVQVTGVCRCPK